METCVSFWRALVTPGAYGAPRNLPFRHGEAGTLLAIYFGQLRINTFQSHNGGFAGSAYCKCQVHTHNPLSKRRYLAI